MNDRAWWIIESVSLHSPDKGFRACLGDLLPDMPRRHETWVALCHLMLKLRGISRSSPILGSDSPQSNNRKDNSLWVTPFIPRERPNVKHAIAGYIRLKAALLNSKEFTNKIGNKLRAINTVVALLEELAKTIFTALTFLF